MKYEEIVEKVKKSYAKADTALVGEHLAVQVNVTGEGEGAFYIEIANGAVNVEPYEYYDRDFIISCQADVILDIAAGKKKLVASVENGEAFIAGNWDKIAVFDLIAVKKAPAKKAAEKAPAKKTAEKAPAKKTVEDAAKKAAKKAEAEAAKAAKKAADEKAKAAKKVEAEAKKAVKKTETVKKAAAEKTETVKKAAEKKAEPAKKATK